MMNRAKALIIAAATLAAGNAWAQTPLTEFVWDTTKTGNQTWQNAANWAPPGFPNDPLHTANLSRPLGANLNVDIGAGVTIAGVTLGATAAPRTTEISSTSAGKLTFRNNEPPLTADFNTNGIVEGFDFLIWQRNFGLGGQSTNANGDANLDGTVNSTDFDAWTDEFSLGSITSIGSGFVRSMGAAGSIHTISAAVHADDEQIEFAGPNNVTVNGDFTFNGDAGAAGVSSTALRVLTSGMTVTWNGGIVMNNADGLEAEDLNINDSGRSRGRLVINGVLSGTGDLNIGTGSNDGGSLGTVELNGANTFTGSIRASRGTLVLGSDSAIGINPGPTPDPGDDTLATYRQDGPANQFGYNLVSTSDSRVIRNNMTIAQWQTIKGNNSLTWAGNITQTNNRGFVNLLPAGEQFTLSGRIDIWEDDEPDIVRELEFDGTGKTVITGPNASINDDPLSSGLDRRLRKTGSGVLVIDVPAGANSHSGPEVMYMGNWHYANNGSLSTGSTIRAIGGAIGVDTGVATNTEFMSRIEPTSTGGLMLAPSDAGATLDFTTTLANAANMTVAAPEGGMTFTGTILPAANRYQLGGGVGTLTLNGAQLTGAANSLEIRNGRSIVQLFGDNTYGGSTSIFTRYTASHELQAAGDAANSATGLFYSQVAPTLEVDDLANGGLPSSIGNSSNAAANLFIQGGTLRYTGAGDSTDRLFTIGTGGATIESSGGGALAFTNSGALGRDDAEDRMGELDEFNRQPNVLYEFTNTNDIIIGMTVDDPDPVPAGGGQPPIPLPAHLIPGPLSNPPAPATTVTGINDDGTELGISANLPNVRKPTRIVFGTVPRMLTLGGTNSGANTLAPVIGNSAAGGIVNLTKAGSGTWILSGNNTYTGTTTVSAGTLIVNGTQTGGGATTVAAGAILGGGGTLPGAVTVNGTVDPGAPGALAGVLSVSGNATLTGTTLIEIGGTGAAQFDQLNMTGTLGAGGVLDVDLLPGYVAAAGHSFDVFDFTSASGGFSFSLPALGGGLTWNTSQLLTTGTLSIVGGPITAVPEPAAATLGCLAAVAVWRRRGGFRRG